MRRVVASAALVTVAVSGCGQATDRRDEGGGSRGSTSAPATSITADGVHAVGVEVVPGVYTTPSDSDCVGYTATNAVPGSATTVLARAADVEGVLRIVVHQGELFTTHGCGPWHRENPGAPKSPDPATLAGGCVILLEDYELVDHVIWYLRAPTSAQAGSVLADMLRAPAEAHNKLLAGPARHLIDALDDPPRHRTASGGVTHDVTGAVAAIRRACARR